MLLLNIVVLIAGFFALIKGADVFVDGSAALAKNFKIPSLIIGLTVVAMGTSAPELAVSVSAGLQGANEIAFSNVVGSNLFNLLVVLGACAVISPLPVGPVALKRDYPVSIAVTLFVLAAVGGNTILSGELFKSGMYDVVGAVTRPVAGILIAVFAAYILYLIIDAKRNPAPDDGEIAKMSNMKCFAFIVI
ncbi:MAG: sodium:calcium antiporter, partial [Thermoguttaceae bacterium]|nr:sodium:calcium antiporter [Thermoguttaceae bacterium]